MKEKDYYNIDYWFNNPTEHEDVDNYGKDYYGYKIYENIILKLADVPSEGYIVLLGTNRCVSFNLLCDHFGKDRCIGYDIYNPTNNTQVITKDCNLLSSEDDIPIAFCHNDLGSFPTTPLLKKKGQQWAAKNVVKGGYFLGRNNLNRAKFKSEQLMESLGFENTQFIDMQGDYDMSSFEYSWIEGHMLSKRK